MVQEVSGDSDIKDDFITADIRFDAQHIRAEAKLRTAIHDRRPPTHP
jgi:hypothetical protein